MAEETVDSASNDRGSDRHEGAKRRRVHVPAAERRRQIVLAAQQVFARTSLQGAKTRDLAKAANVNQATLFEHFRSKEALFQAAVVEPMLEAMRGMRDRAHSYETAATVDELRRMARPSAQRHVDVMIKIFPLLTAALFSDLEAGKKLYREQLAPLLRQRAEAISGFVKPDLDPELVELIGFGSLFAIAMDQTLAERPSTPAAILDQWLLMSTTGFALAQPNRGRISAARTNARLAARRRLGRSELELSPLTFAAGALVSADAKPLGLYLAEGGNCIDVPHDASPAIEQALVKHISGRRSEVVLAVHSSLRAQAEGAERASLRSTLLHDVETRLARLNTEVIDLLLLDGWAPGISAAALLEVIAELRHAGKVRYAGLSRMPAWQVARLQAMSERNGSPFVALQTPYHLFDRAAERDQLAAARELGLGVLPTSPTAERYVKVRSARTTHRRAIESTLERIAAEIGCKSAPVALAWTLLDTAVVSPVVAPRTTGQLEDACAALAVSLNTAQIERLDAVSRSKIDLADTAM